MPIYLQHYSSYFLMISLNQTEVGGKLKKKAITMR